MKIGWIGGWGVSLEEMKAIAVAHAPDAEHLIYPPVVGAAENLSDCDAVIAWSLGAHLVMEAGARGVKFPAKVLLFAPFTSFCSEHGKCGKHSETQVKYLRRWIDTDAPAALADFRKRAGLAPLAGDALPYEKEYLQAGLDLLAQPAGISLITFGRQGLSPGWEAYVGDQDALLDASGICQAIAGCHIVEGLGHDLREFLAPDSMHFHERAETYDAHAAPQKRFAEALAAFAPFRRGVRVTELGAGTGFLTSALLAQGVNVDATDASPAMVELGRQAVPAANWSVHNAFGPIEKAGALASSGLLHWAADPAAILRHWRTALPAGGRLLLGVPCDPCLSELRYLIGEGPVRWRDEAQWLALLKAANFDVHAHGVLESEEIYPSALDFLRSLHRSGVTGDPRFSPSELKSLLRDYDRLNARPDGVVATWSWLLVDATARA